MSRLREDMPTDPALLARRMKQKPMTDSIAALLERHVKQPPLPEHPEAAALGDKFWSKYHKKFKFLYEMCAGYATRKAPAWNSEATLRGIPEDQWHVFIEQDEFAVDHEIFWVREILDVMVRRRLEDGSYEIASAIIVNEIGGRGDALPTLLYAAELAQKLRNEAPDPSVYEFNLRDILNHYFNRDLAPKFLREAEDFLNKVPYARSPNKQDYEYSLKITPGEILQYMSLVQTLEMIAIDSILPNSRDRIRLIWPSVVRAHVSAGYTDMPQYVQTIQKSMDGDTSIDLQPAWREASSASVDTSIPELKRKAASAAAFAFSQPSLSALSARLCFPWNEETAEYNRQCADIMALAAPVYWISHL